MLVRDAGTAIDPLLLGVPTRAFAGYGGNMGRRPDDGGCSNKTTEDGEMHVRGMGVNEEG